MLIDRATSRITIIASTEGGMDIEEVAAKTPEKILKVAIDPATGLQPFHGRKLAFGLGLDGKQVGACVKFMLGTVQGLHRARRLAGRDQPAGRDRRRRRPRARRQDELRRQRAVPPHGRRGAARRGRGGPGGARGRQATTSTTSSSTATSAAWSTAPAWPWRRWTSSSCYGGEPANFLDVGGGATKEQVTDGVQDHPVATPTSKASWSTSSAASCAAT